MRARRSFAAVAAAVAAFAACVLTVVVQEVRARVHSAELTQMVRRIAPAGAARAAVQEALIAEGLHFSHSTPSNRIVSPWIFTGRSRLLARNHLQFRVAFDADDKVLRVEFERLRMWP